MFYRINSLVPNKHTFEIISVFGYATKGVPGLELKGLGTLGLVIKEKLIYLTRSQGIKIPAKRFVLCADLTSTKNYSPEGLRSLELPFLIMYWSMFSHKNICSLDKCFCSGQVSSSFKIEQPMIPSKFLSKLDEQIFTNHQKRLTYIGSKKSSHSSSFNMIFHEELIGDLLIELRGQRSLNG